MGNTLYYGSNPAQEVTNGELPKQENTLPEPIINQVLEVKEEKKISPEEIPQCSPPELIKSTQTEQTLGTKCKHDKIFVVMEDKHTIGWTGSFDKAKVWIDKRCAEETIKKEDEGLETWCTTSSNGDGYLYRVDVYSIPVLWILFARSKAFYIREVKHLSAF